MRRYDIPYVKRGPATYVIPKPIEELTLEELKHKFIRTCGKANGNINYCSEKCKHQCNEGKLAIQMRDNIPLYDGKTLLEKAREENMKRRQNPRTLSEILAEPRKKRKNISWAGWWEESLASGDQLKWVMENMHLTKEQAKQKIYQKKWYQKSKAKPEPPTFDEDYCNLRNDFREYKSEISELRKLFDELKSSFDEVQKKFNEIINK